MGPPSADSTPNNTTDHGVTCNKTYWEIFMTREFPFGQNFYLQQAVVNDFVSR